ncbi:DNA internalization competence protein ComEC/Rec2-like protein [Candidatus Omnitrophus magneticus]|uniref:DNA internalization competence protein ComEC/Rec2-like protein n=1 Tax=Candidatus Omnitrophus magneticus TaxID=1609969 RepID=A0A0F0CPN1_9BACT|nr:DNA internalization competence protein ComEC/Rec2-like protein [Candidatus Omnitrophus magneticus]
MPRPLPYIMNSNIQSRKKYTLILPIIFFTCGIFLASKFVEYFQLIFKTYSFHINKFSLALLFILPIFLIIPARFLKKYFYLFLCLFFFVAGFFRYNIESASNFARAGNYANFHDEKIILRGVITNFPTLYESEFSRYTGFNLKTTSLLNGETEETAQGVVRVKLFNNSINSIIGDEIIIGGKLSLPETRRNPFGIDYSKQMEYSGLDAVFLSNPDSYYQKLGENKNYFFTITRVLTKTREKINSVLTKYLTPLSSAFIESIIIGIRNNIPREINDIFIKTGTMHILSVSGLHIGMVIIIASAIFAFLRLPKNISSFLTIAVIWLYTFLTGINPPAVRSAIMGSFVMLALILNRKVPLLHIFLTALFITLFLYPWQINHPAFVLSYSAVLSIIVLSPLIESAFGIYKIKHENNFLWKIKNIGNEV